MAKCNDGVQPSPRVAVCVLVHAVIGRAVERADEQYESEFAERFAAILHERLLFAREHRARRLDERAARLDGA